MYSLFVLILISFPFQYVFVTKNALMKKLIKHSNIILYGSVYVR